MSRPEDRDYLRVVLMPPRQWAVFHELVTDGADNSEIAKRLFVSVDTVKTHVARILRAVDCKTRCELVARWYRGQLFVIPSRPERYSPPPVSYETMKRSEAVRRIAG